MGKSAGECSHDGRRAEDQATGVPWAMVDTDILLRRDAPSWSEEIEHRRGLDLDAIAGGDPAGPEQVFDDVDDPLGRGLAEAAVEAHSFRRVIGDVVNLCMCYERLDTDVVWHRGDPGAQGRDTQGPARDAQGRLRDEPCLGGVVCPER